MIRKVFHFIESDGLKPTLYLLLKAVFGPFQRRVRTFILVASPPPYC